MVRSDLAHWLKCVKCGFGVCRFDLEDSDALYRAIFEVSE